MTRRHLVAVAIIGALIGLWISPGRAYAGQVEPADRDVKRVHVTYVEPIRGRRLFVELNNGAAYKLRPCRFEDSRGCYWDAATRGNGRGRSFVVVSGRVLYVNIDGMGLL